MPSDRSYRLFLLLAAAAAAVWSVRDLFETDIWWQLASGRWMWDFHQVLRKDPFSLTCYGHPWINHEWLFQGVIYKLFSVGGITILLWTKALLWGALMILLARSFPKGLHPVFQAILLVAAYSAMRYRNMMRPELIAYLLLAWMIGTILLLLDDSPNEGRVFLKRPDFWIGGGLMILWSNIHGSFMVLPLLMGVAAIAWMQREPAQNDSWVRNPFLWIGLGYGLITLINPYGIDLLISIVKTSRHFTGIENSYFIEGTPTPWHGFELYWGLVVLSWLLIGLKSWRNRRLNALEWGWLLFATWLGSLMQRMAAISVVILIPLLARGLNAFKFLKSPSRNQSYYALCAMAGALLLIGIPFMHGGIHTSLLPFRAADFIQTHLPGTSVGYNDLNFGSYLIWRFYGSERPVFLDGRVHPIEGYIDFWRETIQARDFTPDGLQRWKELQKKYSFDWCLMFIPRYRLAYHGKPVSIFSYYFPTKDWALVSYDKISALYVRRRPDRAMLLKTYEIHRVAPDTDSPAGSAVPWETLFQPLKP